MASHHSKSRRIERNTLVERGIENPIEATCNRRAFVSAEGGTLSLPFVANFGTLQADLDSKITAWELTNLEGGSLIGNGTIESTAVIDNRGRIAPGASVGHLTFVTSLLSLSETATLSGMLNGIGVGDTIFTQDGLGSLIVDYTTDRVFLTGFATVPEPNSAGWLIVSALMTTAGRRRRKGRGKRTMHDVAGQPA